MKNWNCTGKNGTNGNPSITPHFFTWEIMEVSGQLYALRFTFEERVPIPIG
jgi:hypothetical protein